jgi:hypothetical protein
LRLGIDYSGNGHLARGFSTPISRRNARYLVAI